MTITADVDGDTLCIAYHYPYEVSFLLNRVCVLALAALCRCASVCSPHPPVDCHASPIASTAQLGWRQSLCGRLTGCALVRGL